MNPNSSRTYPAFPIPAVGAIVMNQEHLLLVQRGNAPAQGKWTLPGGAIELGESPEEAVTREVWEECRLEVTAGEIASIFNNIVRDDAEKVQYHYVIIDYFATCQNTDTDELPAPSPGSDVTDVRWVALQDIWQYDITDGLKTLIMQEIRHVLRT